MTAVAALRAAGRLTLADKARIVRHDLEMLKRGGPAMRRIIGPLAAESMKAYEAEKAREN